MMLCKGGSAALHALAGTQRGVARFKSLRLKHSRKVSQRMLKVDLLEPL